MNGTYTAADAKGATVAYARMAQLGNQQGVVLEARGGELESQVHSESVWNEHKEPWLATLARIAMKSICPTEVACAAAPTL